MGARNRDVSTHGGVATVKLEDRIVERAAKLLVDRLLSGKPDRLLVDSDGDLRYPDCDRIFVTRSAYRQHRTKSHPEAR